MLRLIYSRVLPAFAAFFCLSSYGCGSTDNPGGAPPADAAVLERAAAYPSGGYPRPPRDYASIEEMRIPLADGYEQKVYDVREMTMPIADFRGPDLRLRPSRPHRLYSYPDLYEYPGGAGWGFGLPDYGYLEEHPFEPYYGLENELFPETLDPEQDLIPYLQEGLEYGESPYDKVRARREQKLLDLIVAQTGGDSWKTDPRTQIGYYAGLLVVTQKSQVLDQIDVLIDLLRSSPGK